MRTFLPVLAALLLAASAAQAERVCVEELAGTCLKYADPAPGPAPAPSAEPAPVSEAERVERALGLGPAERRRVQQGLRADGFYDGAIDGLVGPGTRRAIRSWQRRVGEPETGFLTAGQIRVLSERAAAAAPSRPAEAAGSQSPSTPDSPAGLSGPGALDRERTAALIGEQCYFTAFGTPFDMKFEAGGKATATYIEGFANVEWRIEADTLCLFGPMVRREACTALPSERAANERAMLSERAQRLCFDFELRRVPGQL